MLTTPAKILPHETKIVGMAPTKVQDWNACLLSHRQAKLARIGRAAEQQRAWRLARASRQAPANNDEDKWGGELDDEAKAVVAAAEAVIKPLPFFDDADEQWAEDLPEEVDEFISLKERLIKTVEEFEPQLDVHVLVCCFRVLLILV